MTADTLSWSAGETTTAAVGHGPHVAQEAGPAGCPAGERT